MNLFLFVLEIVAPVFLVASIGFLWVKLGFEYRIEFVTQLAMTLSVPCLIFVALMKTKIDPAVLASLSMAAIVAYGLITIAMIGLVVLFRLKSRTYSAPLIFGNTGNLGLPLVYFAYSDTGLSYAVVVFAIMAIWSFTFGIWLVAGAGSITKVIKEPLVWATLLGGLFLWQDWETPRFLTNTLELVGQMAIPMMLITLGVAMARLTFSGIRLAIILSTVKLVVCFAIATVVAMYFRLDYIPFGVLVIQVTTPVAVTSYMLAEKYGADAERVAGLVVVSTFMSVGAMPLILAFVHSFK